MFSEHHPVCFLYFLPLKLTYVLWVSLNFFLLPFFVSSSLLLLFVCTKDTRINPCKFNVFACFRVTMHSMEKIVFLFHGAIDFFFVVPGRPTAHFYFSRYFFIRFVFLAFGNFLSSSYCLLLLLLLPSSLSHRYQFVYKS